MNIPSDLFYAKTHEWVRPNDDGSSVTIGITDHAQEELADIVYIELPTIGSQVTEGSPAAVVESVKAASDIYAPVSGTVTEINEALVGNPALLNKDAFGEGWLFKMSLHDSSDLKNLLSPQQYMQQIAS